MNFKLDDFDNVKLKNNDFKTFNSFDIDKSMEKLAELKKNITDKNTSNDNLKNKIEYIKKLWWEINIPRLYHDVDFNNYNLHGNEQEKNNQKSLFDYFNNFKLNSNNNLLLLGKNGTGKTHLSYSLLRKVLNNYQLSEHEINNNKIKMNCEYVKFYKIGDIKSKYYDQYVDIIKNKLLIVDEIGTSDTEAKKNILFEIVDSRIDDMKPTILISNLDTKTFRDYISSATYSRIKGNYTIIDAQWNDYRVQDNQ